MKGTSIAVADAIVLGHSSIPNGRIVRGARCCLCVFTCSFSSSVGACEGTTTNDLRGMCEEGEHTKVTRKLVKYILGGLNRNVREDYCLLQHDAVLSCRMVANI
jgi:hypothetical protein